MANVTLKNVKKVYDKSVVAVQEFSLEIKDKEFVVLVGPSGCGKSTTLRMVAGLETISSGDLFIGDERVNDVPPTDRDIAMVFQNYALYPHMTVFDNMAFALKLRRLSRGEIAEKVNAAAEILGITPLLKRRPKALSGGQRQRVAIGRAIVRNPRVFLMDEPLSNLDAKLRNQMRAELIKLRQRIDTTFLYVTHDQTEAMTLGDRIVIMKDGYIQQIGTPHKVFAEPANLFVAGFIGSPQMNFFPARLEKTENGYAVLLSGARFPLPAEKSALLAQRNQAPGPATLGIRPEHIRLARAGDESVVTARMDVSEMMGSEVHLHVSFEGKDAVIRVPAEDMPGGSATGLESGVDVPFTFHLAAMHLFDPQTEKNLLCAP